MTRADELRAVLTEAPRGTALRVRVVPRASRTAIAGIRDGALVVRLAAAPVEGAANDLLIVFLADVLDLPRRSLRIDHGFTNRTKRIAIAGATIDQIAARLTAAVPDP